MTTTREVPLHSLTEWKELAGNYYAKKRPDRTGVACPKCEEELIFVSFSVESKTIPPTREAVCQECGFATALPVMVR